MAVLKPGVPTKACVLMIKPFDERERVHIMEHKLWASRHLGPTGVSLRVMWYGAFGTDRARGFAADLGDDQTL